MRVFTVSDIHVDYPENAEWVSKLSHVDYLEDVLILPGDVSDSMTKVATAFESLVTKFFRVFFVPGNHDLWVRSSDQKNSIEKFNELLSLAQSFGIQTQSEVIGNLRFVPLFSWYDFSFGQPSDYIKRAWVDFTRCHWPESLQNEQAITRFFHQKNHPALSSFSCRSTQPDGRGQEINTISFSHFLPRVDVMPSAIPANKREIYPVLGSADLDRQIRRLQSDIHIYGHSHVNRCVKIEGIYYINNAFAYPSEMHIARKQLLNIFDELNYWSSAKTKM